MIILIISIGICLPLEYCIYRWPIRCSRLSFPVTGVSPSPKNAQDIPPFAGQSPREVSGSTSGSIARGVKIFVVSSGSRATARAVGSPPKSSGRWRPSPTQRRSSFLLKTQTPRGSAGGATPPLTCGARAFPRDLSGGMRTKESNHGTFLSFRHALLSS